jgi:hypothetical protein
MDEPDISAAQAANKLDQFGLAGGRVVASAARDHERQWVDMPGAPFNFDERSIYKIVGDEVGWHMTPAQAGFEEVVFCTQIVEEPLALPSHRHLCLLGSRLIVGDDELNMSAELLEGDRFRAGCQRVAWSADRYHSCLA